MPLRVLLTMEHEGTKYQSRLIMEHDLISMVLLSVLEDCKGMTIESIGDLEIPFVIENAAAENLTRWRMKS